MAKTLPQVADSTDLSAIGPLRESFLRHLAAENKSTSTRLTYGKAVEQFGDFTARSGSVANRYRSLQRELAVRRGSAAHNAAGATLTAGAARGSDGAGDLALVG
jgi:hypothetical protein